MQQYRDKNITIYFGDATDQLYPDEYLNAQVRTQSHDVIAQRALQLQLTNILFLKQTHSVTGYAFDAHTLSLFQSFSYEGDFLITQQRHVGLGVMTADCLPLVCYDLTSRAIGIAHVGWRGAVNGIVLRMLDAMHASYQSTLSSMYFLLGPCARVCCYQVSADFAQYLAACSYKDHVMVHKNERYYFDVPQFVYRQLEEIGVSTACINTTYCICTIEQDQFYSYRRATKQKRERSGRQMTVISLQ